jgi:hypothetical protein
MTEQKQLFLEHCSTDRQRDYVEAYFAAGGNITAAAWSLDIDRRVVGRALKDIRERIEASGLAHDLEYQPKILFFDIETSPLLANAWGLWPKYLPGGYQAVIQDQRIISVAYKFRGDKDVSVVAWDGGDDYNVAKTLYDILDKADWVVAHNAPFDIKHSNARILHKIGKPYSPIKVIDTLSILRRNFKFTSNRLDDVCNMFFGVGKVETGGLALWQEVMGGDEEALNRMKEYNARDVELLEILYDHIKGWHKGHPNYNIFASPTQDLRCTTCGSTNLKESNQTVKTSVSEFPLYQCGDCGSWSRGRKNARSPEAMQQVLTHAK